MEPERHEIVIGRFWRGVVRVLAPAEERSDILADLEEEGRQVSSAQGRQTARRVVRWQVVHSTMPWIRRRASQGRRTISRNIMMLYRGLWSDVHLAARRLRQSPGFTTLAVVSLAIGIGAVSTVFSLAHALWLKPLPWLEPDRVVWIHTQHQASGTTSSLSAAELAEYRRESRSFSAVAGFSYGARIAKVNGEPVRVAAHHVSPNIFRVLGLRPALGRDLTDADAAPGSRVVMLSHEAWLRRFGANPAVVNTPMTMGGESFEIAGVMPKGFTFPRGLEADVWVPVEFRGENYGDRRVLQAVARLAPGQTVDDASAEVGARAKRLAQISPATNTGWTATVIAAAATTSPSGRAAFQALLAIVGLFLVIACTNLAGLLLARNAGRRTELAVCLSMGAPRWRLVRSLLVESALLALAGCAAGVLLSVYGARLMSSLMPRNTPGLNDVVLNLPVVGVTIAVALAAAMFVGLLPALSLRALRPSEAIAGSRSVARGTSRAQQTVVVVEIVLAVVLLVGAASMLRSFVLALERDRGYEPRGLQALNVSLPFSDDSYLPTERRARVFDEIIAQVSALPGVQRAAAATGFPGSRLGILGAAPVTPPGGSAPTMAALHAASAGYFDTLRVPIKAGRDFTAADTTGAPGVLIVNEVLAAQFPNGNPIGEHVPLSIQGEPEKIFEIVGVAGNITLTDRTGPRLFVPLAQASPYWIDLVYRTESGGVTVAAVRQALRAFNSELLLENESSLQSIISNSLALERTQSAFAGLVGVLSTLVAGIGLYALMTFITAQRRREFGIRLALGSQPRQLFQGAIFRAMRLVALGLVSGVAIAGFAVRALGSRVFGLAAAGVDAYAAAATIVIAVSIIAAWIPARRAMRTDPLTALRAD
jgi:putative ABC transport system permease protein